MSNKEPVFNLSEKPVLHLIGTLLFFYAVTLVPTFKLLAFGFFALVPMEAESFNPIRQVFSLFGYGFFHVNSSHLLVGVLLVLIFGIITYRGMNKRSGLKLSVAPRFWLMFILGTFFGGLLQWGWWSVTNTDMGLVLGASAGGSAYFAAAGWAMGGKDRLMVFGAVWLVLNGLLAALSPVFGSVYWVANIGGFIMGALLSPYWVKPSNDDKSIFR